MTNLPPSLTPEKKLDYLASKLETLLAEMNAALGIPVMVDLIVFNSDDPTLAPAAEFIGLEFHKFQDKPGGWWDYNIGSSSFSIITTSVPQDQTIEDVLEDKTDGGLVYFADRHDIEVLGAKEAESITDGLQ